MKFIVDTNSKRTYISGINRSAQHDVIALIESECFILCDSFRYYGDDHQPYARVDVYGEIPKDLQMQIKLAFG